MATIATTDRVDRSQLLDFARTRHRLTLVTTRRDGRPQLSPVTGGLDSDGRIVISTYPDRAKARNLRRNPAASVLVHSDEWDGPYVQVDGTAEVLDMPSQDAEDALVEYFQGRGRRRPGPGGAWPSAGRAGGHPAGCTRAHPASGRPGRRTAGGRDR